MIFEDVPVSQFAIGEDFHAHAFSPQQLSNLTDHSSFAAPAFVDDLSMFHPLPHSGSHGDTSGSMTTAATTSGGEEIVVIGARLAVSGASGSGGGGSYTGRLYEARMFTDDSGGSSEVLPENTDFLVTNDDATCEDGAAVNAGQDISGLLQTEGQYEFTGLLVQNSDGSFGLSQNEISTNYSATFSSFDSLLNYSSAFGVVHNHVYNTSIDHNNDNFLNRYPSAGDWQSLDLLVHGGANPGNLSIFILDPFGTLREFNYSDRSFYESMTDQQRLNGDNLPAETHACS